MKKLQILIVAFLISLSICALASTQVRAVVITVNVTPTSWTMDAGQSKTFTASATTLFSSGSLSYVWKLDGNTVGSNADSYSYSPTSAGLHSLTVDVDDSSGLPVTSSPVSVMVNPALVAPTVTSAPSAVDQGQTSSLTSTSITTGTSPYTYQWLQKAPNAGSYASINGATSSNYNFATSGSTATGTWSFELQVTDATGASPITSSPVSVMVNPALVAPTLALSYSVINQGQTSILTSSAVSTGTSPYKYQWLQKAPNAGSYASINGATSSNYNFATSGSTAIGAWSFELRVTDAVSAVVTSSAVSVTVNAAPTVTVSPTSWTMDVGQSKTFTATASGGSGTYTNYQWYVAGVARSGETTSTFNYSPTSPGSYSITATVTDSLATTSAHSSAASIKVNAMPTVSVAPVGPVTMDVGQVQVFTATVSGGSGSLSYQWYLDGSAVGSNSARYSYTAAGSSHSVTCKVTDSASVPVTSGASNAVLVTVNPALVAPTLTPTPSVINQGQTSSLASSVVSTGTLPYTYQWFSRAPGAGSYSSITGANSD